MPPPPVVPPARIEPLLLTKPQAAAALGIGESTLERYCAVGVAPRPRRFGSVVRWDAAELREWIAAGCPRIGDER